MAIHLPHIRLRIPRKVLLILVFVLFIFAGGAGTTIALMKNKPELFGFIKPQNAEALAEINQVTAEIGSLLVLPTDEKPTLATVTDAEKIKNESFFKNAVNGDKVLIYPQSRKVILYRPSEKKIIEVGSVTINNPQGQVAGETAPAPVKIALYNGTAVGGITQGTEKTLKEKVANLEVVLRQNAAVNTYTKTLVIDLTGTRKNDAEALAKLVGGEVSTLPEGEVKPGLGDFLIIVGQSQ